MTVLGARGTEDMIESLERQRETERDRGTQRGGHRSKFKEKPGTYNTERRHVMQSGRMTVYEARD